MAETEDVEGQIQGGWFPLGTSIIDFAYDEGNPLREGYYDSNYSAYEDDEYFDRELEEGPSESGKGYVVENESDYQMDSNYKSDIIDRKAIALFDFVPESDNEVGLTEGQIVWVSYRHGQGWLVSEDLESGKTGLVPEEYVKVIYDDDEDDDDDNDDNDDSNDDNDTYDEISNGDVRGPAGDDLPKPFLPLILHNFSTDGVVQDNESEWEDTDEEENHSLKINEKENGSHSLTEVQDQLKGVTLSHKESS